MLAADQRRPTGQVRRDSVAGEEVLERAAEAAEFTHMRARTGDARRGRAGSGSVPGSALRTERDGIASGIGLALAWHGAGFTGSGEVYLASVASVELTADGRIRVLTANTEMGQGTKTVFPQMVAGELGVPVDWVEYPPQDTAEVMDSGPTVASRTVMVVGGLVIKAARRLKEEVEARNPGVPFHEVFREDATAHGATRIDQKFEPYPGITFDDATYTAKIGKRHLDLTFKEFELLKFLAQHPGRVFSRQQLLQEVWGYDYFGGTRTVDVHVRRLRAKLGPDNETLIGTVRNVGYKAVRPARGRPSAPGSELSDDVVDDAGGYDTPDGLPDALVDPLRSQ